MYEYICTYEYVLVHYSYAHMYRNKRYYTFAQKLMFSNVELMPPVLNPELWYSF